MNNLKFFKSNFSDVRKKLDRKKFLSATFSAALVLSLFLPSAQAYAEGMNENSVPIQEYSQVTNYSDVDNFIKKINDSKANLSDLDINVEYFITLDYATKDFVNYKPSIKVKTEVGNFEFSYQAFLKLSKQYENNKLQTDSNEKNGETNLCDTICADLNYPSYHSVSIYDNENGTYNLEFNNRSFDNGSVYLIDVPEQVVLEQLSSDFVYNYFQLNGLKFSVEKEAFKEAYADLKNGKNQGKSADYYIREIDERENAETIKNSYESGVADGRRDTLMAGLLGGSAILGAGVLLNKKKDKPNNDDSPIYRSR